jgi:hypothetical protein
MILSFPPRLVQRIQTDTNEKRSGVKNQLFTSIGHLPRHFLSAAARLGLWLPRDCEQRPFREIRGLCNAVICDIDHAHVRQEMHEKAPRIDGLNVTIAKDLSMDPKSLIAACILDFVREPAKVSNTIIRVHLKHPREN